MYDYGILHNSTKRNLLHLSERSAAFVRILVTSSKGGIGKSTVAVGIALAFVKKGKRVLLCDCDLGNRCLDMFLGVSDEIMFDIGDVAAKRAAAGDALVVPWRTDGFYFCPSPLKYSPEDVSGGRLAGALSELEKQCAADVVICDTAGMICAPEIAAEFADTAIVVSTQQPASVRAAENTAILLRDRGLDKSFLVISGFEWKSAMKGSRASILDIIDGSGIRCIGIVPYDRRLMLAGEAGKPPADGSAAMQAFMNIAARLDGYSVKLFSGIGGISGKKSL